MRQGRLYLGSPGARCLKANGTPSYAANSPTHGMFRGAHYGPCLPSNGLSCSGWLCLHMLILRASRGSNPGLPELFHGGGSVGSGS